MSWFDASVNIMQRNQKDDKPKTDSKLFKLTSIKFIFLNDI